MNRVDVLISGLRLPDGRSRTLGGNFVFVKNLLRALDTFHSDLSFKVLCDADSTIPLRDTVGHDRIHVCANKSLSVYEADNIVRRSARAFRPLVYHRPTGQLTLRPISAKSVMGVADLNFVHLKRTIVKKIYKHISYSLSVRRAARIICVSEFTRRDIEKHFPQAVGKTKVVYHGPPVLLSSHEVCDPRKESMPYFLTFAHQAHKNVEVVISALKQVPGRRCELKIVGQNDYVNKVLRPMVQRLDLGNMVEFCGRVDGVVLDKLYRSAVGLVFMSKFEGFGLPLLEAMARDCPIIASKAAAIPEVCGGAALLYDVCDIFGVAGGMRFLLDDDELRSGLISMGRLRVEMFSWRQAAAETVGVYRELFQ